MDFDRQRELEKCQELLDSIINTLQSSGVSRSEAISLGQDIFDSYISTTAPEAKSLFTEFIVMGRMGEGGGKSTKAGNIRLNIGKFMEAVASGALTAVGAIQIPITAPLAALVIWCSLRRSAQVDISETEATVLYTMWVFKDENRDVPNEGLLEKCNSLLSKYGRQALTQQILVRSLKTLEKIETIEKSPRKNDTWWLREWVSVSYR
ncbi:MAG: hypothetical protein QM709_03225 [Spongiibacteraceae bacterium]